MNLDLASEFLAGLCSGQVGLGNNLEGPGHGLVLFALDWLDSLHLVALGETSFAKEASALISNELTWFVGVFWIDGFDFLFNDLCR